MTEIDFKRVDILINLALEEDVRGGDATSISVIPHDLQITTRLVARENCVVAGLPVAEKVFKAVDDTISFEYIIRDGSTAEKGTLLAEIRGNAGNLLTAERTALNFLQRLTGVATASANYAKAVEGTDTVILDTRKTTPAWRNLEKYAVAVGGSSNHRMGLYDRIMIKDNHRELAGLDGDKGITRSVKKAKTMFPALEIEVEADTLEEVKEAADAGADYILLDNMSNEEMKSAVQINAGRSKLEASGGITLERIPSIAAIGGIDFISVGALTHSVRAIDISMEECR
jgi:nicotinate-nucleotide pyrophosphorylase (carboxylating)